MEHAQFEDRASYEERQVAASRSKFSYCKFSYRDAERYLALVSRDRRMRGESSSLGPIVCLGVRGGREVDLFRTAAHASALLRYSVKCLERRWHGMNSRVPALEGLGRSDHRRLNDRSCVGVEINPLAERSDVLVSSYDRLPQEWTERFGVVFSNSFDHAYDPFVTAAEWKRVIRPGGYLVLDFPQDQRSAAIDPVGLLTLDDVRQLFAGDLVYFHRRGSRWEYSEFIVRF